MSGPESFEKTCRRAWRRRIGGTLPAFSSGGGMQDEMCATSPPEEPCGEEHDFSRDAVDSNSRVATASTAEGSRPCVGVLSGCRPASAAPAGRVSLSNVSSYTQEGALAISRLRKKGYTSFRSSLLHISLLGTALSRWLQLAPREAPGEKECFSHVNSHSVIGALAAPRPRRKARIALRKNLLHMSVLGSALSRWLQSPPRSVFTAERPPSVPSADDQLFLFTAAASAPLPLNNFGVTSDDMLARTRHQDSYSGHAQKETTEETAKEDGDVATDDRALDFSAAEDAKSSNFITEERQYTNPHGRKQTALSTEGGAAAAREISENLPVVYKVKVADTAAEGKVLHSLRVMILPEYERSEEEASAMREAGEVLVVPEEQHRRRLRMSKGSRRSRIPRYNYVGRHIRHLVAPLYVSAFISVAASLLLLRAMKKVVARNMKVSRMDTMILSLFRNHARARLIAFTVIAGIAGHALLRRLTVLLITFTFIGAVMGVLVLHGSQALVDRVTAD